MLLPSLILLMHPVNMEILKTNRNKPSDASVKKIVSALSSGGLVVLPTETVYTFAVDATNEASVDKIFYIKSRDKNKPLHVVVDSLEMAERYVEVNDHSKLLSKALLPGPLTLVLKKKAGKLAKNLAADLPTLGIRIPDLKLNQSISNSFKKPYTTTSANVSGGPDPYTIKDVFNQLSGNKINLISLTVDVGRLPHLKPSTLVDLTQKPIKILREGPVTSRQIKSALV